MFLDRLNIKFIIVLVSLFIVPTILSATWTVGLEEAARALYNGKSTIEQRFFLHEHINEINDMALSGDLPDNLYQSVQGDFFDRNYADLKTAAAQEDLDITMKKPEHFEPGTDTDAPLTRKSGSDTDITLEKLKKVEKNYKNNIRQHYEDANLKTPTDIPDTNTDILVDPDATSQFEACSKYINDNGGTAYKDPDAVRVEIKTAKGQPISIKEASAYTDEVSRLANKKSTEAQNLRKKASILEKSNPKKARKLRTQAQLADSQASKYINRSNKATNKLRKQHGLEEIPFDNTSSLDKAIRNIDKNTGQGRNMLTEKDAITVGNMQKHASEKASQKFIDSLGDIAKARPHTAKDVQKAIAKRLNTMTPSAQGRAIENLERKVGGNFTKSVVNEAKVLKGIKVGKIAKPMTPSKKVMNVLTKPRTLGATGKKVVAVGYKAVNVTMIAGSAYFMGKDGVYHALKNVKADQTEFEFFLNVYKEAAWHGSGLGYAYEEAEAEELAMWKREIERGEPSDSMRKHVTITIGKTIVYLGRDIVVGTLTLPYVFLEYVIGFEDAERREQYSKAFLAEVRRQVKSKKEFQKALDIANEDGIAFKDQKMYLNCMCSDCGGSLGGFFRPEFQGGGYGPCQCNGPLTIWKTPISSSPDQRATCTESIRQMNNRITDSRMDELHKIAMAENAKSVQKELEELKQLSENNETLTKATQLFLDIEPLLYPKDAQDLRKVIEPRLAEKAHEEMQKGNLKNTIKNLERKNRVAGLPDDRTYAMAQSKTWLKSWENAKKFYFTKIRDYLANGQLIESDNTFRQLHGNMKPSGQNKESLFPPAFKDPDYLALIKMRNEKKEERMKDIGDALSKSKEFVLDKDPKSAVILFENVLNKWEHTKADKAQLQKELKNRLKILVRNAQAADKYGDKLKKEGDFSGAVESYSKSVAIQKDSVVQRKLDELLEKVSELKKAKLIANINKIKQEAEKNKELAAKVREIQKQAEIRKKEKEEAEAEKVSLAERIEKIRQAAEKNKKETQLKNNVSASSKSDNSFSNASGKWNLDGSKAVFTHTGNKIIGSYDYSNGKVYGTIHENIWNGFWTQDRSGKRCATSKYGSFYWGRFHLIFNNTFENFSGEWSYCDNVPDNRKWKGARSYDTQSKLKAIPEVDEIVGSDKTIIKEDDTYVSFAGTWTSNWGNMEFTQTGNIFHGTYTHDKGQIDGKVMGNTMYGTWSEAPTRKAPKDAGDIEFVLAKDGKTFKGNWRYGSSKKNWDGTWTGKKLNKKKVSGTIPTDALDNTSVKAVENQKKAELLAKIRKIEQEAKERASSRDQEHSKISETKGSGLTPVQIKLSKDKESYGGSDGTITSHYTLRFWNVGSKVSGYGRAELDISSVSSKGKRQKFHYVGTFEGGPNGDMELTDGEMTVHISVIGGEKVTFDGAGFSIKIPNPSVFNKN